MRRVSFQAPLIADSRSKVSCSKCNVLADTRLRTVCYVNGTICTECWLTPVQRKWYAGKRGIQLTTSLE